VNEQMVVGLAVMTVSGLLAVFAAAARAEAYTYLPCVLLAEWGAMVLLRAMFPPGLPRTGVTVVLALAMGSTALLWWKALRKARSKHTEL